MKKWEVYGYVSPLSSVSYDGRGSSRCIVRVFTDKPSALRKAQRLVEAGPCDFASVTEVTEKCQTLTPLMR